VQAALVFRLRDGSIRIKETPEDVLILRARQAAKTLKYRPTTLTVEQVEALWEVARWEATWQS